MPNIKKTFQAFIFIIFYIFLSVLTTHPAQAHAPNENYVWLNVETDHLTGRFEINFQDLSNKLGITWNDATHTKQDFVTDTADQVWQYLNANFDIQVDGQTIQLMFQGAQISEESDEYVQYHYTTAPFDFGDHLDLTNTIFLSPDTPLHRSLIVLEYNRRLGTDYGGENAVMAFGLHNSEQTLDLANPPEILKPKQFVWQGVLHTVLGYDHVLFLLALLMTAVMIRNQPQGQVPSAGTRLTFEDSWKPVLSFKAAFWNVIKIATLFTLSHSITLSLTVLGLIDANTQLIETLIALSIVVVAMNNIFPRFNDKRWVLIILFGLVHGMGFASAMGELQFRTLSIAKILIGFNVGIELGQIIVVVAVFPIFFALRKTRFYRVGILIAGSAAIAAVALYWAIERAFGL